MRTTIGILFIGICFTGLAQNNTPQDVVNTLFEAAKTDNPALLKGLCPPNQSNDGDTDCVCALASGYQPHKCAEDSHNHMLWKEYVEYFERGKINGEVRIGGNYAKVPFVFGLDASRSETMGLVLVDGRWYLMSF